MLYIFLAKKITKLLNIFFKIGSTQLYKNWFCGLVLILVVINNIRSKRGKWQNTELGVCKKHLMYITLS